MKKFIILLFSFFLLSSVASAENEALEELKGQLADQISEANLVDCRNVLVPVYDIETLNFYEFLDDNFKNKSNNSSLTNIAIARFSRYKLFIEEQFAKVAPQGGAEGTQQASEFTAFLKCSEITNTYIKFAKEKLITHIKANSYQKKSDMLLEKYKAIGERMRELNLSIAEMNAFFKTFENKLPGFLRMCTQS